MKAGDRIEAVTKSVGIEPCKGCQERKLLFNRRGWIGGTAATLYLAKNALLTKMWEVAGAEVEVSVHAARAFVRQFTTVSRWYLLEYGHHGELADRCKSRRNFHPTMRRASSNGLQNPGRLVEARK